MAYNSRLNNKTGHHALPVLLSSRLTHEGGSLLLPLLCGITVGAVIPTAHAFRYVQGLHGLFPRPHHVGHKTPFPFQPSGSRTIPPIGILTLP